LIKYFLTFIVFAISITTLSFAQNNVLLEETHKNNGITCENCHGTDTGGTVVKKEKCMECHGDYNALVQTSSIHFYAMNPHWTTGQAECTDCHHIHHESESVCSKCHYFPTQQVVP
jgi:fumarate reductase flavoprotein subunit